MFKVAQYELTTRISARSICDRYGGSWVRERFMLQGIEYLESEQTKTDLYREVLPALNAGRVELLDLPVLRRQLLGLERRSSRSGRDSIDHAVGARDDVVDVRRRNRPAVVVTERIGAPRLPLQDV